MNKPKLLITIPCYNEEIVIEKTTFQLIDYANEHLKDYDWKLLILDNNSKDKTWQIAQSIRDKNPDLIILDQVRTPGRGAALRESWGRHLDFDIYSYMDADLATDIKDLAFLISRVKDGSDFVAGSRYIPYSNVKRSFVRKFLSLIYNILLRLVLHVSFKDAQCGFKAFSKKLVKDLIPKTTDNGWFWDTELMIIASRFGYKVEEVPVTWREVRDELRRSTVSVWSEIWRNLKNIWVMRKKLQDNNYGA